MEPNATGSEGCCASPLAEGRECRGSTRGVGAYELLADIGGAQDRRTGEPDLLKFCAEADLRLVACCCCCCCCCCCRCVGGGSNDLDRRLGRVSMDAAGYEALEPSEPKGRTESEPPPPDAKPMEDRDDLKSGKVRCDALALIGTCLGKVETKLHGTGGDCRDGGPGK